MLRARSRGLRRHLLACAEKLDEILAAASEPALRPDIADADSRAATVKQRPTSRRITPAEISVRLPVTGDWGTHGDRAPHSLLGIVHFSRVGGPSFGPHSATASPGDIWGHRSPSRTTEQFMLRARSSGFRFPCLLP